MNKAIVTQTNLQNQGASWNDDPFDLPWSVNGVTSLTQTRDLHFYAQDIVAYHGKFDGECYNVTFSDLPDYAKNELASLYFEYTGRETSECVHGTDYAIDNDFTCALLSMLKNDCKKTRDTFADVTRKNIIKHYEKYLQKVLDDACNDYLCIENNNRGLYSIKDRESGEVYWSRV